MLVRLDMIPRKPVLVPVEMDPYVRVYPLPRGAAAI